MIPFIPTHTHTDIHTEMDMWQTIHPEVLIYVSWPSTGIRKLALHHDVERMRPGHWLGSVLWHHWLGDTDIRPTGPVPLILNFLFQNQWRNRTTAEMFFQTQTARRLPKLTLNFKFVRARDQTCLPVWIYRKSVQQFPRYPPEILVFVHGDLDLWPWESNSSERGTKHVLPVNLAQICSVVPEIFHTQTKKSQTAPKAEPYTVHCVR